MFYWVRLGSGVFVLVSALMFVWAVLVPGRERPAVARPARNRPNRHRRPAIDVAGRRFTPEIRHEGRPSRRRSAVPGFRPTSRAATSATLFEHAWRHRLPLLLKGPTGCGKTRFVAHMAARLGAAAAHRRLPRRSHGGRPHRPLSAQGRRHGLGRRSADPRGARGRHLLPRRGGRGAQGRHRRAASADRRPPHPAAGAHRRGAGRAAGLHARRLLQPRLPEHPEGAEAVDAPALRRDRVRLSCRPSRRSRWSRPRAALRPSACVRW